MGGAAAGTEVERYDQSCAASDAMAFDGRDGDLIHFLPGPAHLGAEPLFVNALADGQRIARTAFGIDPLYVTVERIPELDEGALAAFLSPEAKAERRQLADQRAPRRRLPHLPQRR